MLWPQKLKKDDLCWEKGDISRGAVVCSLGGESWHEEEEGEVGEERVGRVVIY
jgi:hypothetical protein